MNCKFRPGKPPEEGQAERAPGKYMTTVRMGPRGQLVIPKEARELFGLHPGDSLLLLADEERGLALLPADYSQAFFSLLDAHFSQGELS